MFCRNRFFKTTFFAFLIIFNCFFSFISSHAWNIFNLSTHFLCFSVVFLRFYYRIFYRIIQFIHKINLQIIQIYAIFSCLATLNCRARWVLELMKYSNFCLREKTADDCLIDRFFFISDKNAVDFSFNFSRTLIFSEEFGWIVMNNCKWHEFISFQMKTFVYFFARLNRFQNWWWFSFPFFWLIVSRKYFLSTDFSFFNIYLNEIKRYLISIIKYEMQKKNKNKIKSLFFWCGQD